MYDHKYSFRCSPISRTRSRLLRRAALAGALLLAAAACQAASHPSSDRAGSGKAEPREFTLVATGDVLLHERLWNQARDDATRTGEGPEDFAPQLAGIEPIVSGAGLAFCHLETPLAPEGGPYRGYPLFSSPPSILPALVRTGYDACTTASNHTFDAGADGVDRTLDHLDAAGLAHAGSARDAAEAAEPTLLQADTPAGPVTVALLAYTYDFNGLPHPDGDAWRGNLIDEDRILSDAAQARAAGAEFVVAAMHWGDEYVHEPNEQQLDLAPRLLESPDIDLLLGHHAHVVQPVERIGDEWVTYGLGNLMSAHRKRGEPQQDGLLVRFTVTEDATGGFSTTAAEYLPLLQTDDFPVGVVNVPAALDGGDAGTADQAELAQTLERTTGIVESRGAAEQGLAPLARTDG